MTTMWLAKTEPASRGVSDTESPFSQVCLFLFVYGFWSGQTKGWISSPICLFSERIRQVRFSVREMDLAPKKRAVPRSTCPKQALSCVFLFCLGVRTHSFCHMCSAWRNCWNEPWSRGNGTAQSHGTRSCERPHGSNRRIQTWHVRMRCQARICLPSPLAGQFHGSPCIFQKFSSIRGCHGTRQTHYLALPAVCGKLTPIFRKLTSTTREACTFPATKPSSSSIRSARRSS